MFGHEDGFQQAWEQAAAWEQSGTAPPARVPVVKRDGTVIGTVPSNFNPYQARSSSPLYDFRKGDFEHTDDGGWRVAPSLGGGDLACVPGFQFADGETDHRRKEEMALLHKALDLPGP